MIMVLPLRALPKGGDMACATKCVHATSMISDDTVFLLAQVPLGTMFDDMVPANKRFTPGMAIRKVHGYKGKPVCPCHSVVTEFLYKHFSNSKICCITY